MDNRGRKGDKEGIGISFFMGNFINLLQISSIDNIIILSILDIKEVIRNGKRTASDSN